MSDLYFPLDTPTLPPPDIQHLTGPHALHLFFLINMVVPILIGVGITVLALTAKATAGTFQRYSRLSPQMIATLNKIRLETGGTSVTPQDSQSNHIRYLKSRFNNSGFENKMTEREALLVLGIEANDISSLTKENLRLRYRKLMIMNHPDKNGSMYMSQKINQAKDILEHSYLFKK